jgi:2-phosphosulfolactate phosphatase
VDAIAVVDVLRATTMVATLLHHGASAVIAAAEEALARALAAERGALLAGEVGGLPPPGFDLGNSPASLDRAFVAGREVVLFTTNGTRALCAVAEHGRTVAAAAVNLGPCARWLARFERVLVVCAGEARGTSFALDDFAAAALLVGAVVELDPGRAAGDGARLALALPEPLDLIPAAEHASTLRHLGLGADIEAAMAVDTVALVPVVVDHGDGWARLQPTGA